MKREELFKYIQQIEDPKRDYAKILTNLHYTHFYLMDRYRKMLLPYDLTLIQSNVLGIITHHNPTPMALEEIKALVLEPNADVSRTVGRLTEKGFVEKVIDKTNRRKVSIRALPKGIKMMKKIEADPALNTLTEDFTLSEARNFVKYLNRLRND